MGDLRSHSGVVRIWSLSGLSLKEMWSRIIFFGMILFILILCTIYITSAIKSIDKHFAGFLLNERLVIAGTGQYHWTGTQAGLRFPDKILKANNIVISSVKELEEVIMNLNVGDSVTYSVDRSGKVIQKTIPTMRFTLGDVLVVFGTSFVLGISYLAIGIIVFVLKPDTKVSWAFLLACFFLSGSGIISSEHKVTYWGFRWLYSFGTIFFPAAFVHLSLQFPEPKRFIERYPNLQLVPYILSIVLFVLIVSSYPEPLFVRIQKFIFIYIIIGAIAMLSSTVHAYLKKGSVLAKQRAKVVLFGAVLAFPLPAFGLFFLFLGGSFKGLQILVNWVTIPIIIFPACIAYAIAKHNLFDVDVYIKRTVGYVLMTVIVGMAFISMQTVIRTTILNPIVGDYAEQVYPILFSLLIVFFFNPINRKIQGGVDKIFFRKQFDYKQTISAVSNALTSMLNLDQIVEQVSRTVRKEMFVDTVGMIVLEPQKTGCQTFFVDDEPNHVKDHTKDVRIAYDDPLLALLSREKRLITKYDIAEDARYADVKELCGQSFSEMAASIAIPLMYQDKVTGALALGYKKSGHFYTREDVDLLTTLADQGAVAIENARLFKENLAKGRMEEELKIAHDIQVSMLPDKAPEIEGFKIVARSISAREVGGDFYDFIEMGGDGAGDDLAIVIGDVSGKGVSAALLMSASRSTYRVLVQGRPSVEEVMNGANQRLNRDIKKGTFVALLYAVLDPREKTLKLSNAGQTQPIICPGDKSTPFYIDTEGDRFPLGIVTDCHYQETRVPLQEADAVVFYTDGVVEALNDKGELYGFERLMTSIEAGREFSANALLEKLMDDVLRYVGDVEQHDDLTMVVVKVE